MNWRNCLISEEASILDAVKTIDCGGMQIALIVDKRRRLCGVLTDGDIRRAVLNNVDFNKNITTIMKKHPIVANAYQSEREIQNLMRDKQIHQVPVIDDEGCVLDVVLFLDVLGDKCHTNPVVLMAGGMGKRLLPLTADTPKPLLRIGTKPILEIILENFVESGFSNFYISVNYKSEQLENYFRDGSKWGIHIHYLKENIRLGTAGGLSLLPDTIDEPIIVMNGDILTKIDIEALLSYHLLVKADATMAIREYDSQIPYGVIKVDDGKIVSIEEKPFERYWVNAGIYVLNSNVIGEIEENTYTDMTCLLERLIRNDKRVNAFPIREYWIDIGKMDDFEQAQMDFVNCWRK